MLKTIMMPVVLGLLSLTAAAQKAEIFGGYQFTHLHPAFNGSGWNVAVTGNFKHVLGITADFSGAYKRDLKLYTYTFGPVLTARLPVVQPFVHALFGGATLTNSGSISGFAMFVGGGLDVGSTHHADSDRRLLRGAWPVRSCSASPVGWWRTSALGRAKAVHLRSDWISSSLRDRIVEDSTRPGTS